MYYIFEMLKLEITSYLTKNELRYLDIIYENYQYGLSCNIKLDKLRRLETKLTDKMDLLCMKGKLLSDEYGEIRKFDKAVNYYLDELQCDPIKGSSY